MKTIVKLFTTTILAFTLFSVSAATAGNQTKSLLQQPFFDNVEWHEDFAIDNIEGWIMMDHDGLVPSGPFQNYPNKNTPMAFIVYNPSQTDPPNAFPEFAPRSGNKVFMSIGSNAGANNDWLITRELAPHTGGIFSFYAKGTFSFFGPEEFRVGYSNTGTQASDFIFFHNPIEANFTWTHYQYTIPATARHIAIVHVSYAYCFMVDDISFTPSVNNQAPGLISGYSAAIVVGNDGMSVDVTWTNPSETAGGGTLTALDGIKVFRGSHPMSFVEVADFTTAEPGAQSLWTDSSIEAENHYAYRLVGYNSYGNGQIFTSDYLFPAFETVPGAPHEVFFDRNEQNQTVISWNEVNYGEQGGLLTDPVIGYTLIRSIGDESVTLASIHSETSFTETDAPPINLYNYQIIAHTSEENFGAPAARNYYTGLEENQQPVTWGIFQSQQVFELNRSSILSQSIFTAEELGSSGLITGLTYFSNIWEGAQTNNYKIYISKTNRNVFGAAQNNMVWENFANQKLVYDGPVSFNAGRNAVQIAFDQPFFFDADDEKNVIITVIKPLDETTPTVNMPSFFNTPVDGLRTFYAIGYGVDMSTITQQPAAWATEEVGTIPSIVTTKETEYGAISGTVYAGGDNGPIGGVSIIVFPHHESDTWQSEVRTSNANGQYAIEALLPGHYIISFHKEGYNSWQTDFTIEAGQELTFDAWLSDANSIYIAGVVNDQSGSPLDNARATLSGYSSISTTTNEQGQFLLPAFGDKEYSLKVSHPLYLEHEQSFMSEETTFALDTIILDLQPHKPMNVVAALNNGVGHVSWDIPYGLYNETGLQWGSLTQYTGWGWGGAPFTAGIRFTISDLQSIIPEDGVLTHVKAYISNHANIHIEVFEGSQAAELIYTHPETISEEGWYTFELDRAIPIDISRELWIGIRFEAGYGTYPIGIDEGPNAPQRKGSMLYENGIWTPMSLTNKNWNIYGITHKTLEANPAGYNVYRGLSGSDIHDWDMITPEMINEPHFEDATLPDAGAGIYRYGVVAHYPQDLFSAMNISNQLLVDMQSDITIVLQPNTGNANGAYMSIAGHDHFYEKTFEVNQATLQGVWHGTYDISVQLENFEIITMNGIFIGEATTLEIPLTELKPAPSNLRAIQQADNNEYLLTWTLHAEFTDNMESYLDFAKENIGTYILKDLDGLETYTYTNFTWPGAGNPMSFMVFNPYATIPAISLDAHSGRRYLVALAGPDGVSNDWLIIPAGEGDFSFMARSLVGSDPETFHVHYSLGGSEIADFILFETGTSLVPPATWTRYSFKAPPETNFLAIQYTGNDTYFLLVDDLQYQKPYNHLLFFNIYLDGALIAGNVIENSYLITSLQEEFHLVEVAAVYQTGISERSEIQLQGITQVDMEVISDIRVYPNPSIGLFTLDLPRPSMVKISTLSGTVVYQKQLEEGSNLLNTSLPPGSYMLYVICERRLQTKKLVIGL